MVILAMMNFDSTPREDRPIKSQSRPLGFAEAFLQRFHDDLDGGLVTVAVARLRTLPEIDAIRSAAIMTAKRHPLLRMKIAAEADRKPFFHESQNAGEIFCGIIEGEPKQIIEGLLGGALSSPERLWELHVLPGSQPHLFLKIHHAIADGMAVRSLLNEILAVATEATRAASARPPTFPLRSCVEELMAQSRSSFAEPLPPPSSTKPWVFTEQAPLAERQARAIFREIPAPPIVSLAHEIGVTVNSLLLDSLVRASRILPGFPEGFPIVLPVGVRNRLDPPIPGDEMGCLIGNAVVTIDAEIALLPRSERAPLLERLLSHAVAAEITSPVDFSPADVDAAVAPFADPARNQFVFPLALSNIGRDPDPSPLVEACWFGASVRPGHLGILAAASTTRDKLCIAFHYAEPLVSEEAAEGFADEVMERFSAL